MAHDETRTEPRQEMMRQVLESLDELQAAESNYRHCHDVHGDGSREAGYAWDQMRKVGDRAREVLLEIDAAANAARAEADPEQHDDGGI